MRRSAAILLTGALALAAASAAAQDQDGVYNLQHYDRTLSGNGIKLVFKSMRDGDELRTVTGNLVKTAR